MKEPLDNLTLSAADGEALIARVHRSDLPRADAETVEWMIRMYFYVALALQEGTLNLARLRALLFGPQPSPSPEPSLATSQVDGEEASTCSVVAAEAEAGAAVQIDGRLVKPAPRLAVETVDVEERFAVVGPAHYWLARAITAAVQLLIGTLCSNSAQSPAATPGRAPNSTGGHIIGRQVWLHWTRPPPA